MFFNMKKYVWDFPFSIPSTKSMDSLTLKPHNFFQNKTHSFASRPLIFKLQLEV